MGNNSFSEKELVKKGKHLAFLLRHDADAFNQGLIDKNGWRSVKELESLGYSKKLLEEITLTNNKQRYEFSADGRNIRARQGHSIPVDVGLVEQTPPDVLYHGTTDEVFYEHIVKEGLVPMTRLHVHLSKDEETATNVGKRHGKNVRIIRIDAKKMYADGCKFWLSNNGVWLTEKVEPKYFIDEEY